MDIETAEAIQRLVRMIDNVNERNSLAQLSLNGVMVLLASSRRQGFLSPSEIASIEETFRQLSDDEAVKAYPKVRRLFETARQLWEQSSPG